MRSYIVAVFLVGLGCGRIGYDGQATDGDGGVVLVDAVPGAGDAPPGSGDASPNNGDAGVPFLGCSGGRPPLGSEGLVGHWSFNDGKGTDWSPSRHDGILSLAPANGFTAGVVGMAMVLDGQSTCLTVPDPKGMYDTGTANFTVGLWVDGGCSPATTLLSHGLPDEPGFGLRCNEASELQMYARDGSSMADVSGLSLTTGWHFLALVKDGIYLKLYMDGEFLSGIDIGADITSPGGLYVGRSSTDAEYFVGAVDEVRIYDRALSPVELRELYDYFRPGVIAHWPLDGSESGYAGLPYTGINIGGVPFDAGRMGQAAAFHSAGGQIKIDMPDVFQTTYSAELWFQTSSTGGLQSLLNREVPPRASIQLWVEDTRLKTYVRGDNAVDVGTWIDGMFTDGCWHHAVLVREGGDLQDGRVSLYLDGTLMSSTTGTFGASTVPNAPLMLGYRLDSDPWPFAGSIDEVRIFDRALTAQEVAALHSLGK